jgi:hypothetical protein
MTLDRLKKFRQEAYALLGNGRDAAISNGRGIGDSKPPFVRRVVPIARVPKKMAVAVRVSRRSPTVETRVDEIVPRADAE